MLRLDDISYSVDGRPLIEHASAVIPTGHKVGLVGRNGTGKTTLFRLIRGELTLDTGSIEGELDEGKPLWADGTLVALEQLEA